MAIKQKHQDFRLNNARLYDLAITLSNDENMQWIAWKSDGTLEQYVGEDDKHLPLEIINATNLIFKIRGNGKETDKSESVELWKNAILSAGLGNGNKIIDNNLQQIFGLRRNMEIVSVMVRQKHKDGRFSDTYKKLAAAIDALEKNNYCGVIMSSFGDRISRLDSPQIEMWR